MNTIDNPITHILAGIARERLGIETLAVRNRDSLDFHDVSVSCLTQSLGDAYEAGYRAAVAAELGVTGVIYSQDAERFPWQVFCTEERCVLISRDLKDHLVIASEMRAIDQPLRVPVEGVGLEVLEVVRRELYGARR
ncbi:MAG: hypothetical protein KF684_01935 [Phycisphaeraceae bacterium]|nr:hypothetical protein [Phycisphaeraceae bacterium]